LKGLGYGQVIGLDASEAAIRFCAEKDLGPVQHGDVCHLPFESDRFQLILATDLLEHVDDDAQALSEMARVLAPGGTVIVTVPAFASLWGLQDEVAHHKRRYRLEPLVARLDAAGLVCRERGYFNYLLFAPIWMARQLIRALRLRLASENELNAPGLNRLLTWIFACDVWSARRVKPPFGVSIFAVAKKMLEIPRRSDYDSRQASGVMVRP
jgi:SAM-dependent methyltransferase